MMNNLVSLPKWPSSISELRGTDLRMIVFPSRKEYERGSRLFIRDEELSKMPHEISPKPMGRGYAAFAVPAATISLIKKKGLRFRVVEPITMSGLTPAQREDLKEQRLYLIKVGAGLFLGKFTRLETKFLFSLSLNSIKRTAKRESSHAT